MSMPLHMEVNMEYFETNYTLEQLVNQVEDTIDSAEADMSFDDMINSVAKVTLYH